MSEDYHMSEVAVNNPRNPHNLNNSHQDHNQEKYYTLEVVDKPHNLKDKYDNSPKTDGIHHPHKQPDKSRNL